MLSSRSRRARKMFERCHKSRCTDLIGAGSFGDVFQLSTSSSVVKICKTDDSREKSVVFREIEIMRACDHPNILGILDHELCNGYTCLYMEMCTPLTKILRQKISDDELREYVMGMVSGIEYLHGHHIMHRDLKPSNLLINMTGVLVIADFGLAIQLPDDDKWDLGRRDGDPYTREVCTRWWRPPEVLLQLPYTWRIDIWSMGCIVYELVLNFLGVNNAVLLPAPHTRDENEPGDDQLMLILNLLGSPTFTERANLTNCPLHDYAVSTLKEGVPAKPAPEGMPPRYGEIIHRTMRWLPQDRSSAADLVSLFDSPKRAKTE